MDIQFFLSNRHLVKTYQLYISGFPSKIQAQQVKEIFQKWVPVKKIRIDKSRQKKTHGFVDFYNIEQMVIALQMTNEMSINGESVIVQPSKNCIVICNYCKQLGHWKNQCEERLYQKRKCFGCGQLGHIFKQCKIYNINFLKLIQKKKKKQSQKQQQKMTYNQEFKPVKKVCPLNETIYNVYDKQQLLQYPSYNKQEQFQINKSINTVSPLNETIYNINNKSQIIQQEQLQFVQILPSLQALEQMKVKRKRIINIPIQLQQYQDKYGKIVLIVPDD